MKTRSIIICLTMWLLMPATHALAQEKTLTNRYSMKLTQNEDGSYSLQKRERYAKIIDLDAIEDLTIPYKHVNDKLTSKLYKNTETEIRTYKKHESYELQLAIDKAVTEKPAPVMFFCHGGGWERGSFESSKSLSRYLAQQHGITCVRISYTLATQPGAHVEVSINDVMDAVKYICDNAESLNIDPKRIGFYGTSAGAHLAACAAMKCKDSKVLIGYSGIYDLTTAAITTRAKTEIRKAYFGQLDQSVLRAASPAYMIPAKKAIAAQLYCGTGDITVEWSQSKEFANKLTKANKSNKIELLVYENYDHNLSAKSSDKMEEIFFKTAQFVAENL